MEGFASCEGEVGINPFVDFGEGVKQAPGVAGFELRVPWFTPFVKHMRNLRRSDRFAVNGSDDEVVGSPVV